ncbi:MAG: NRDE family protein [Chitinophagaceae bacterium]|nr:NRDE family protein [Chitinophagaceae bacterium]
MRTVTYIPSKNDIFITSIRKEKIVHTAALPPEQYSFSSGSIIFPKEIDTGGSWIACHANGNAVAFLNETVTADASEPSYRKSRGLILLDLADHTTPFNCFLAINLNRIAPFTAVILDSFHLFECSWDGRSKSFNELDAQTPHIWSSALYVNDAADKRKAQFEESVATIKTFGSKSILDLHQALDNKEPTELQAGAAERLLTTSITLITIGPQLAKMQYLDVIAGQVFDTEPGAGKTTL